MALVDDVMMRWIVEDERPQAIGRLWLVDDDNADKVAKIRLMKGIVRSIGRSDGLLSIVDL